MNSTNVTQGSVFLLILVFALALEKAFAVLVHLEPSDCQRRSLDVHRHSRNIRLFSGNAFDMNDPLFTINAGHFPFTSFVDISGKVTSSSLRVCMDRTP